MRPISDINIGDEYKDGWSFIKCMKKFRFYFHFNKPLSKKVGRPQLSIHFQNKCCIVDKITCFVDTESKNNSRQPHCVMRGWADRIIIDKKEATVL
ncbi:MAG: hypothetical protein AABY22_18690 [Nanoarchaeota archaeon]